MVIRTRFRSSREPETWVLCVTWLTKSRTVTLSGEAEATEAAGTVAFTTPWYFCAVGPTTVVVVFPYWSLKCPVSSVRARAKSRSRCR